MNFMKTIPETELVLNKNGSIYHLNLKPKHIAKNIIIVGDQNRVKQISKYFDKIEYKIKNREFITHTGYIGKKRLTVLSTGIGTDNIDIVMNELDALVNIDLENRIEKIKKTSLNIIRLGTSGAIQKHIEIDSFLASSYGMGIDNLMHFYDNDSFDAELTNSFNDYTKWNKKLSKPYFYSSSKTLLKKFSDIKKGITVTSPGFYAPQGREVRLPLAIKNLEKKLENFSYKRMKICNYEMETSALYGLGKILGHECLTVCAIIANRKLNKYSKDYIKTIENLILLVLEKISNE